MDKDSADKANKADAETLDNISELATAVGDAVEKPQAGKIATAVASAVAFIIHCFSCKNAKKTPTMVKRDSIEVRRARNAYQVSGVCATCGRDVRGFISADVAKQYEVKEELPGKAAAAGKRKPDDDVKPRKKRAVKTGDVPAAEEDKK